MRLASRSGFTLVEIIAAAFVFAVGVLALEATAVGALRQMRRSSDLTLAAAVARSRLEKLAAASCVAVASGSDTVRGVVSTWSVEATGSPSVRAVSQSVAYSFGGVDQRDAYRSTFSCSP